MGKQTKNNCCKIIFMTSIPFIKQHLNDMYINSIKEYFDIELWDLSEIFNRSDNIGDNIHSVKKIESIYMLETELNRINSKSVVITNIHYSALTKIYKIIKDNNLDIITITKESFMNYILDNRKLPMHFESGFKSVIKRIIKNNYLVRKILYTKRFSNVKFDYLLAANNFYPELTKKFVKIHQIKWDEFLSSNESGRFISEKYAVFLDAAIIHHPMYLEIDQSNIQADKYLKLLNKYFKYIENKYNLQVVISAHPKSSYDSDDFNGRKIIKYNTPNLIRHCEFALAHYTTSVFNVVLEKKPIIFLYYNEMIEKSSNAVALGGLEFARRLKSPIVNLEDFNDVEINANDEMYKNFKENYIVRKGSLDKRNSQLIIDFLNRYFEQKNY